MIVIESSTECSLLSLNSLCNADMQPVTANDVSGGDEWGGNGNGARDSVME